MIDNIEANVMQAEDYTKTAKEETKKAVQYQSSARKVPETMIRVQELKLTLILLSFSLIFRKRYA